MSNNMDIPSENPIPPLVTGDPQMDKGESAWELVRFALIVLVIAVGLRFFIAQPFVVSGSSMVPTFTDKDYLIIDELSYNFKDPQRGDVIVFHPPNQPVKSIYYIKRVIGLPGETVFIKDGKVKIVNAENPDGFILDEPYISAKTNSTVSVSVGTNEYFVMGDNRPFSSDSRMWGVLPKKNIVGRAFLRLLPFTHMNVLPGEHNDYVTK